MAQVRLRQAVTVVTAVIILVAFVSSLDGPASARVSAAPAHTQQDGAEAVAEIIERVGTAYAAMSVYFDRGVVTITHPGEAPWEPTQRFSTEFERNRHFKWTSDLGRNDVYGVVADGTQVFHVWNRKREAMDSIDAALGRGVGVSHLTSDWVPALLMPEAISHSVLRATLERGSGSRRLPDEVLNGRPCFVVGAAGEGFQLRVWISKRDYLIRRIEQRYPRYNSITTTDYTPQTDISLAP